LSQLVAAKEFFKIFDLKTNRRQLPPFDVNL